MVCVRNRLRRPRRKLDPPLNCSRTASPNLKVPPSNRTRDALHYQRKNLTLPRKHPRNGANSSFSSAKCSDGSARPPSTFDGTKYSAQLAPMEQPPSPGSRSRSGCNECRRRRRKCDEVKPTCSNCRRSKKTCSYLTQLSWGGRSFVKSRFGECLSRDVDLVRVSSVPGGMSLIFYSFILVYLLC